MIKTYALIIGHNVCGGDHTIQVYIYEYGVFLFFYISGEFFYVKTEKEN